MVGIMGPKLSSMRSMRSMRWERPRKVNEGQEAGNEEEEGDGNE
jgi:hypothetical protein